MSMDKSVEVKSDGKQMTYGELKGFVAELGAAGAADATPVKASITWGGGLKSLTAVVTENVQP